jgi:hypothetical protein
MSQRDPISVLHAAILASKGGISGAAKAIGRSAGVLYNKFSDGMPHYEVSAREALALADHLGTTLYAEAICEHFGGVFLPMPEGMPGDDDVLQSYLDIISQMGQLSKEFTDARQDGIIDPAEFEVLQTRASQTVMAIMHLMSDLQQLVREVPCQVVPMSKAGN